MISVAFISVVPSPYQRDLFRALARHPEINLKVYYLENSSPDSPWPQRELENFEAVLPGFWVSMRSARFHFNWPIPDFAKFDVVVSNSLMSFVSQWTMRFSKKPFLFWGERLRTGGILRNALSAPLHDAQAIVSIGSWAQRDYQLRFPNPKHFCIPYHCDLEAFLQNPRRLRDHHEIVFIFCGQMIARKGINLLLNAFARLVHKQVDARLLLVGREADLPNLLSLLPEIVRNKIEYAGFQPPEKLPEFFARADVFVLPSRYDGWGVVVNQALGAGLPVICSDAVGASHDLLDHETNGLRFKSGDEDALFQAMSRIASNRELITAWGDASRTKAADWSPENGAKKWMTVLREVLAK